MRILSLYFLMLISLFSTIKGMQLDDLCTTPIKKDDSSMDWESFKSYLEKNSSRNFKKFTHMVCIDGVYGTENILIEGNKNLYQGFKKDFFAQGIQPEHQQTLLKWINSRKDQNRFYNITNKSRESLRKSYFFFNMLDTTNKVNIHCSPTNFKSQEEWDNTEIDDTHLFINQQEKISSKFHSLDKKRTAYAAGSLFGMVAIGLACWKWLFI